MFHGLVKDSATLYVVTKAVKKARRKGKTTEQIEIFTPEAKAAFANWLKSLEAKVEAKAQTRKNG